MKEKRKTRLNKTKGSKTEFVGFGAFADPTNTPPPSTIQQQQQSSLRWSPVYAGKNSHLASFVFPRLIKKDTTTKIKALQDLQAYYKQDDEPRKEQVDALAHFMFLYHSKLSYDSSSSVRAESVLALTLVAQRVPKAFASLVKQNNLEVLGMMYCCHGDPAAEVRFVVSKHVTLAGSDGDTDVATKAYSLKDVQTGIWAYVERILSYGRANKMHEDLFSTRVSSSGNSKDKTKSNTNAEDMSEAQKDELEERFERIVGTALSGMQVWIDRHGIVPSKRSKIPTNTSFLWKTMSSPRTSIRNRTYALLGSCCQKSPSLVFDSPQSFGQTFPQALASEKEGGNIVVLFEALLAYLAAYSKHCSSGGDGTNSPWDTSLNADTVIKHLVKIFKKACYGASARQWGPSLLPLLAMLPSSSGQVAVLGAAWKGREQVVRDHFVVVQTVSESASFFLQRNQQDGAIACEQDIVKEMALLWLDCLKDFLEANETNSSLRGGPTLQARNTLLMSLSKELQQFDQSCYSRPNCPIFTIQEWFWKEVSQVIMNETTDGDASLATLVQQLSTGQSSSQDAKPSHLFTIMRKKFHNTLSAFQGQSSAVPTLDKYEVMVAILRNCGVRVFEDDAGGEESNTTTLEKFLMNDVLRWMVLHTSSLSTLQQSKALAKEDFTLFDICAAGIPYPGQRKKVSEALIREVIAAKCRLDLFTGGLVALTLTPTEYIRCNAMDNFAVQVVKNFFANVGKESRASDEGHSEEVKDDVVLKEFLQTASGLVPEIPMLVGRSVLTAWIDLACPQPNGDQGIHAERIVPVSVLETLLKLSSPPSTLDESEINRVILQSWHEGGDVWFNEGVPLLMKEPSQMMAFFRQARNILHAMLVARSAESSEPHEDASIVWARQAWRLLALSKDAASDGMEVTSPSLELVCLSDVAVWDSPTGHEFFFACLMHLLGETSDPRERLRLLQGSASGGAVNFIVWLLRSMSEASTDWIGATRASNARDRCSQLLAALGGRVYLKRPLLLDWLKTTVKLTEESVAKEDIAGIRKGVALIARLCCLLIDRVQSRDVLSEVNDSDDDIREEFERDEVAKIILPILKKGSLSSLPWGACIAELVSVVVFYIGTGSERGIGSLHYHMFQLILGMESRLRSHFSSPNNSKEGDIVQETWLLAMSCGFGLNTPSSEWSRTLLAFDPDKITAVLLDYSDARQLQEDDASGFGRALLSWLSVAVSMLGDESLKSRALKYVHQESTSILASHRSEFESDELLALRGLHAAQTGSRSSHIDLDNLPLQSLMAVTQRFTEWEDFLPKRGVASQDFDQSCKAPIQVQPVWRSLSHFAEVLSFALAHESDILVSAAAVHIDGIVDALHILSKQWLAFRVLDAISKSVRMLGDPTPEGVTAGRLTEWVKSLDAEEAKELEEDVEIVCEMLPHSLMTEIETWSNEDYTDLLEDQVIVGRMLTWLVVLQFVDAFIRKDPSNRLSLCSYIGKCGASDAILTFTVLHNGVGTDKKLTSETLVDVDIILQTEAVVQTAPLASLVLFRSVEALPTLSRRWWEEECPKVYAGPIRDYVEAHISPVILQRELEQLKYAMSNNVFGAMTVTGSVATREITATYVQDEITLKVMISLPPFFPLRNAEVDCSRTLGIPAKRWKLWSLQITMMLNKQGGTLQEALGMWKENVDKEFSGVEPCPVCYSVLHIKTHKLPELECTTCSNRFHVQCLTQWFRSSGKTQCVLCQQPWAGTRVKK